MNETWQNKVNPSVYEVLNFSFDMILDSVPKCKGDSAYFPKLTSKILVYKGQDYENFMKK